MPPSLVSLTIKKTVLKNVQQPFDQRRRLAPRLRPPRPPVARPRPRWREVRKPSMGVDKRRAFPTFELIFFPFKVAGSYFELNTEPVVYIGGCSQPSRIESNRVWRRLGPFGLIFFRLPRISGGAAPPHSTLDFTRGHFSSGLVGCVKDISIQVPPEKAIFVMVAF